MRRPYRQSSSFRFKEFATLADVTESNRIVYRGWTEKRHSRSNLNQSPTVTPANNPGPKIALNVFCQAIVRACEGQADVPRLDLAVDPTTMATATTVYVPRRDRCDVFRKSGPASATA